MQWHSIRSEYHENRFTNKIIAQEGSGSALIGIRESSAVQSSACNFRQLLGPGISFPVVHMQRTQVH
jgi:hypothetical protein